MSTVRTERSNIAAIGSTIIEWCGLWQPRPRPLDPHLPALNDTQIVAATAPSLEAALTKARQLIDRTIPHPPSADRPLLRPIPALEKVEITQPD